MEPATQVHFTVGNHEITNLIVQDQVGKVKVKMDILYADLKVLADEVNDLEAKLGKRLNHLGHLQWEENVRNLVLAFARFPNRGTTHLYVMDGESAEEALAAYEMKFEVGRDLVFMTRELDKEDGLPKSWPVRYRLRRGLSDREESQLYMSTATRGEMNELPVTFDEECIGWLTRLKEVCSRRTQLRCDLQNLRESIKDTTNIEKRVLAALTQRTLEGSPEIKAEIYKMVGLVEGGLPLLQVDLDTPIEAK